MMLLLLMGSVWSVTPQPTHILTVNLDRTANPTVSEVTRDVFPPAISPGAAPGSTEPSCLGAGVVDHALVDEGEPAGGGTARGRGG